MSRLNKYDRSHLAHLSAYQRQVDAIYAEAAKEAARLATQISDLSDSAAFSFSDYPITRKRCETLLKRLENGLYGVVANGIRSEWTLANNKNDELSRQVFGANVGKLSQEQYRRYFSSNGVARDAFIARRDAGMNLSDRVWNYISQFKAEMEQVCELGIRNGMSAEEIQRELQQYLNHPDNFFRRFRYKEGVDDNGKPIFGRKWKKRYWDDTTGGYKWEDVDLNDYRYGRGVYRSSYKNARRLAVTETNIAYRTADHLRWQQMDFVVGIHIEPSNTNHPVIDICDILAGDYPKDFKWTGWHPHCRCHATSILKTEEEMVEDNNRILAGEEPSEDSVNTITGMPLQYREWCAENADKILASDARGTLPYFVKDNYGATMISVKNPTTYFAPITEQGLDYLASQGLYNPSEQINKLILSMKPQFAQQVFAPSGVLSPIISDLITSIEEYIPMYAARNPEIKRLWEELKSLEGHDVVECAKRISGLKTLCGRECARDIDKWRMLGKKVRFSHTDKNRIIAPRLEYITADGKSVVIDAVKRDLVIFVDKFGREYGYPIGVKKTDILLSPKEAARVVRSLPPQLSKGLTRVSFVNIDCPHDPYWKIKYSPNHVSAATDGSKMHFWKGAGKMSEGNFKNYISHEAAHVLDNAHGISTGRNWAECVADDILYYESNGISHEMAKRKSRPTAYALNNDSEDFAESVMMFVNNPKLLKDICPNRYKFITELFKALPKS